MKVNESPSASEAVTVPIEGQSIRLQLPLLFPESSSTLKVAFEVNTGELSFTFNTLTVMS